MDQLTQTLHELKQEHGLLSLKAGTEWEDMDCSEISHLYSLGENELPILVKIGGPEAKSDLRRLRDIGVNGILGPMIESEYALEKFVETVQQVYDGSHINPLLAINIETIQGYKQLDTLMKNPAFAAIDTVVIGRLDLSLSMHIKDVDHPEVSHVTKDLATRLREAGKNVSVGGFVNPSSVASLHETGVNQVNTIHTLFDLNKIGDAAAAMWKAIEFEIAYYRSLIKINPERTAFYQERIDVSQGKLDKAEQLLPSSNPLSMTA